MGRGPPTIPMPVYSPWHSETDGSPALMDGSIRTAASSIQSSMPVVGGEPYSVEEYGASRRQIGPRKCGGNTDAHARSSSKSLRNA